MFNLDDPRRAERLRALAHPARLAILRELARRGTCICAELVELTPRAQSTVSQHLKVLKDAGLVVGSIDGPRSCYRLDPTVLRELSSDLAALFAELSGTRPLPPATRTDRDGCDYATDFA